MLEIIRFHMTLMHLRENVCFHLLQCKIVSHGSATMKKLFRIFIFYSFITRRTLNKVSINQQFLCISYFIFQYFIHCWSIWIRSAIHSNIIQYQLVSKYHQHCIAFCDILVYLNKTKAQITIENNKESKVGKLALTVHITESQIMLCN